MAAAGARPVSTANSEPPARVSPRRRSGWTPWLLSLPGAGLYCLFVLWPMLRVVWLSLMRWNGLTPRGFVGLANMTSLWDDPLFRLSLGHTLLWDVAALLIPTLLALAVALLVSRSHAQSLALAVLFFPVLLPPSAVAAIWTLVYSPISGLIAASFHTLHLGSGPAWLGDPHLALPALFLAWLWSALGVGVTILWAGLRTVDREWTEIALLEGAGPLWRFRHVILPGIRRPLAIVLLVNLALGSAVFDLIFVTTGGGPGYATMTIPLEVYGRVFGDRPGQGAAAACIQLVLGLLLAAAASGVLRLRHETTESGSGTAEGASLLPTAALLVTVGVMLLPLLWLIPIALTPGRSLAIEGPGVNIRQWGWRNLLEAWNAGMEHAIGTSLFIALLVLTGTMLLAIPAAFSLVRYSSPLWSSVAAGLLLAGLFQATPALLVPLFALLSDLHLLDTIWGIVLPEVARAIPFAVLALWAFLSMTPKEVLEAAEVDGAAPLRQLLSVALPIARPALLAIAVWTFATSWSEYLLPTLVSQDGSIVTVPTLLGTFIGTYNTQLGPLAAGSLLAILPALALYVLFRRGAAAGLAGIRGIMR